MKIIESIQKILQKAAAQEPGSSNETGVSEDSAVKSQESERLRFILEGMGTGTARIVIDKEATRRITEEYEIKGLTNQGRYYVARVVRPDGSVIDELLVDKQTGGIQFLKKSA